MKILITGGTGYLGGRLVDWYCSNTDHQIFIGTRSVQGMITDSRAIYRKMDWTSSGTLEESCDEIDLIIHLAALDAPGCAKDPILALEVNGLNTVKLLEAAVKKGVKRFVYLSTAHVYGSVAGVINEETPSIPVHSYATSHKAAEDVLVAMHLSHRIDGRIIRLSNSFGAPYALHANCWQLLVPQICKEVVLTGRIILQTPGLQKRNFIPIIDAVRAIAYLSEFRITGTTEVIYNVGGPENLSVLDMALRVQERYYNKFGTLAELIKPESKDQVKEYVYQSLRLIQSGFKYKSSIDDSIDELLNYCKANFHA